MYFYTAYGCLYTDIEEWAEGGQGVSDTGGSGCHLEQGIKGCQTGESKGCIHFCLLYRIGICGCVSSKEGEYRHYQRGEMDTDETAENRYAGGSAFVENSGTHH